MNLKKIGKVLTSKSVGNGPSSYEKRIYRAAVSQRLRNTVLAHADDFTVPTAAYSGVSIFRSTFLSFSFDSSSCQ